MNDLIIQPGERILKEESEVMWRRSWLAKPRGRLCFTTQRLFFEVPKQVALTGSQAIQNELTNRVPVDLPRDSLEEVERTQHGKHDALIVRTRDEELKFLFLNVKEWEAMLRQAMYDDKVALADLLERLKPKEPPPPYR